MKKKPFYVMLGYVKIESERANGKKANTQWNLEEDKKLNKSFNY